MSNNHVYDVLIVGVGGQGIILASDVLSQAAARNGYDVKKNEIHGMAQRGGSYRATSVSAKPSILP